MSDQRIHDSLNLCFHRHRLVFWYDPSGEWKQSFEGCEQESVETRGVEVTCLRV
ncbi:MAG: hypothetical protein ACO3JG_08955 [Luteolibacter sp.]